MRPMKIIEIQILHVGSTIGSKAKESAKLSNPIDQEQFF